MKEIIKNNAFHNHYHRSGNDNWRGIIMELFNGNVPEYSEWSDISTIVNVLNRITDPMSRPRLFFPEGGSEDFMWAEPSVEDDFINLVSAGGVASVVKPKRLIFKSYKGFLSELSYFRLETKFVENIFPYGYGDVEELLTVLPDGTYLPAGAYYGEMTADESLDLSEAQQIHRYSESAFVLFSQSSSYKGYGPNYEGRHNLQSAEEFQEYVYAMGKAAQSVGFYRQLNYGN